MMVTLLFLCKLAEESMLHGVLFSTMVQVGLHKIYVSHLATCLKAKKENVP